MSTQPLPGMEVAERDAPGLTPPQILIVDDATVVRLYYRQILEESGYRIEEAINGLEGMEKAVRTPFELCIVDVNMPVMDGYAFLRALRREPSTSGMVALMTSTEAGAGDYRAALEAGANFYLVKPVARVDLSLHIAALLGRSRAAAQFGRTP